ncbi:hypothetical protein QQP08_001329 [Theobroma cacao]|nr:hypothetical protein QQP08_001329 [Theobroma cacao]
MARTSQSKEVSKKKKGKRPIEEEIGIESKKKKQKIVPTSVKEITEKLRENKQKMHKKKETEPSLQKGISSSSSSKFRNKLHEYRFKNIENAPISCEKFIAWKSFKKNVEILTNLSEYFNELKLKGYSTFKNRSYSPSLVKEFYSHIALKEKELAESDDYVEYGLNVYLNGKEFIVTVEDLGNLLEIEGEIGEFELPEKYDPSSLWEIITERKQKYSSKSNSGLIINPQIRILHYFIAANIQGRSGSFSYISLQDLWLMEHAFDGVSLYLGRFMIEKMRSACRLDKVNLPYGNVITSLVQKKGI